MAGATTSSAREEQIRKLSAQLDALRDVSRRIEVLTDEGLGVLVITHYSRLLEELRPDVVHVLAKGVIVATGGPELADQLEETGYAGYAEAVV